MASNNISGLLGSFLTTLSCICFFVIIKSKKICISYYCSAYTKNEWLCYKQPNRGVLILCWKTYFRIKETTDNYSYRIFQSSRHWKGSWVLSPKQCHCYPPCAWEHRRIRWTNPCRLNISRSFRDWASRKFRKCGARSVLLLNACLMKPTLLLPVKPDFSRTKMFSARKTNDV